MKNSTSSIILILKALISNSNEVTALNGGRFLTTRVSNHIVKLRQSGLDIDTQRIKTDTNKWYGSYKLVRNDENLTKAKKLLLQYEVNRDN